MTAPKPRRKTAASADRHVIVGGARWHYPKMGDPTVCAVEGCTRVLGQMVDEEPEVDEPGA